MASLAFRPKPSSHSMPHQGPAKELQLSPLAIVMTTENLTSVFKDFNNFEEALVPLGHDGKPRGFGYVSFGTLEDAVRAFNKCHENDFQGMGVQVTYSARSEDDKKRDKVEQDDIIARFKVCAELELRYPGKTLLERAILFMVPVLETLKKHLGIVLQVQTKFRETGSFSKVDFRENSYQISLTVFNMRHLHNRYPSIFINPPDEILEFEKYFWYYRDNLLTVSIAELKAKGQSISPPCIEALERALTMVVQEMELKWPKLNGTLDEKILVEGVRDMNMEE